MRQQSRHDPHCDKTQAVLQYIERRSHLQSFKCLKDKAHSCHQLSKDTIPHRNDNHNGGAGGIQQMRSHKIKYAGQRGPGNDGREEDVSPVDGVGTWPGRDISHEQETGTQRAEWRRNSNKSESAREYPVLSDAKKSRKQNKERGL